MVDLNYSVNVFKDVLLPAATAVVALWFAMRKFKGERLWQEKYSAYQKVLEAVEGIRFWGEEVASEAHLLPTIGDFQGESARNLYLIAQRELVKQAAIGTLLLPQEFIDRLKDFNRALYSERYDAAEEVPVNETDAAEGFGKHGARVRDLAEQCLSALIELARKDLGVRPAINEKVRAFARAQHGDSARGEPRARSGPGACRRRRHT